MIWIYLLQIALGIWIFARGQEKKEHFAIRAVTGFIVIYIICQGTGMLIGRSAFEQVKLLGTIKYVFDFFMVMLLFYHCYQLTWKEVIFFATSGYALQNITHYIYAIVLTVFLNPHSANDIWTTIVEWSCYIVIYLFAFERTKVSCRMENSGIENKNILAIASIMVFLAIFLSNQIPMGGSECLVYFLYDISGLVVVLFLQYGLVENNELQKENHMIQQMLSMQKEQQEIAKDTIALINLKCHDLKHQMAAFEKKGFVDEKVMSDIKDTINTYDSMIQTGNEALDIILTEKSLKCTNCGITFTHLVDGRLFDFMEASDIYSFFGNILDNAIEALLLEEEKERYIYLKTAEKGNLICVHAENYCSKRVKFEDGLPVTTKTEENGYHGFGTKSIRFIAEKYHGFTQMTLKNNIFSTDAFLQVINRK